MERKPTEHKDSLRHQQSIGPVRAVSTSALEANQTSGKHGQATYTSKYLLQEMGGWAHFIIHPHTHNRQSTSFSNATAPVAAPLSELALTEILLSPGVCSSH